MAVRTARSVNFAAALVVVGAAAGTAQAQGAGTPAGAVAGQPDTTADGGLDDIIVTAQRRSEALQDTPLSIAALTSEALEQRGVFDINDLRAVVPNVQITPFPTRASSARIFIRGIGSNDDQITADPSVAVYVDGVYVARTNGLGAEVADVERIEVLRGPQGSLYGRNATGGAINYITRPPEFGDLSGKQTLMVGNYNQFRSRTSLNLPVGDTLAVSLGYLHARKDGFIRNLGTGVRRWGDQRREAYRAAVRWAPAEGIDIRYAYDRSDINDTPVFAALVPLYPARAQRPTAGSPFVRDLRRNDNTSQGHNLTATWEVSDGLSLKSITAYRKLSDLSQQNFQAGVLGPFETTKTQFDLHQRQFTQELQALGTLADGQLEYVVGAYYFDEKADTLDNTRVIGVTDTDRAVTIDNKAYALFGQATFRPQGLAGAYITGGLRWSRDEREATLQRIFLPVGSPPVLETPGRGARNYSNVAPTVVLGYNGPAGLNLYAKYSKGYKTGGFNLRASSLAAFNAGFGQETLDSYEAGIKSEWLDRRLRVNLALFRSNYRDIQTSVPADLSNPTLIDIFNAGQARIQGAELDITAQPTRDLNLNVSYALLDAQYTRVEDAFGNDITSRYYFINAPTHSITTSLDWTIARTGIGNLSLFVDYFMQDLKFVQTNLPQYKIGSYGVLNGRLTLADIPLGIGRNWRLAAFGKNLTNLDYYVEHFPTIRPAAIFGDPRSYGLELSVDF